MGEYGSFLVYGLEDIKTAYGGCTEQEIMDKVGHKTTSVIHKRLPRFQIFT